MLGWEVGVSMNSCALWEGTATSVEMASSMQKQPEGWDHAGMAACTATGHLGPCLHGKQCLQVNPEIRDLCCSSRARPDYPGACGDRGRDSRPGSQVLLWL